MKLTIEIPDNVYRAAEARAVHSGVSVHALIVDAVREKLLAPDAVVDKPWMRSFGVLRHLHEETTRIDKIIEEEFRTIDPEDWA